MPAPSGNKPGSPNSQLSELGIVLPVPPTPLGSYVESSDAGNLLFLSGTLPVVNRKLAIRGRLGENLSVKEGQEAARIASLNALAAAKEHLGDLDRLRKLVKLTVLMATTEQFSEHASVADGASVHDLEKLPRRRKAQALKPVELHFEAPALGLRLHKRIGLFLRENGLHAQSRAFRIFSLGPQRENRAIAADELEAHRRMSEGHALDPLADLRHFGCR